MEEQGTKLKETVLVTHLYFGKPEGTLEFMRQGVFDRKLLNFLD